MAKPGEPWTAEEILLGWGCHQRGALPNPTPNPKGGGNSGPDDTKQAAKFMELTEGFEEAIPVLKWVYADMKLIESFPLRSPGETRMTALSRWHWAFALIVPDSHIPLVIHARFFDKLSNRLRQEDFIPNRSFEEISPWELEQRRNLLHRALSMVNLDVKKGRPTQAMKQSPQVDWRSVGYETAGMSRRHGR